MSRKKKKLSEKEQLQKEFEDSIVLRDMNFWDSRLRMDPINGLQIQNSEDLIGFWLFMDEGNPFEYLDFRDIFY